MKSALAAIAVLIGLAAAVFAVVTAIQYLINQLVISLPSI